MNEPDLRIAHGNLWPLISHAVRKPCPRGDVWVGKWMLNPEEGGRLDARRHYVILAKALDGIWTVGHACAMPCTAAAGASAQHCTGMTNWPNTIQCLG